jgi:hypothetical protein
MEYKKSFKSLVRTGLIILLFLFIIIYARSRTSFLSQGVSLSVENLEDGQKFSSRVLNLEGTAKRAVMLTINNREVLIDENGDFKDTLILYPGLNILTIEARDKFENYKQLRYSVWNTSETNVTHLKENFEAHIYQEESEGLENVETSTQDDTRIETEELIQEEITN